MPRGLFKSRAAFWELRTLSLSEIAIKNRSGKLTIPEADVHETLADLDIRILPYNVRACIPAVRAALASRRSIRCQASAEVL